MMKDPIEKQKKTTLAMAYSFALQLQLQQRPLNSLSFTQGIPWKSKKATFIPYKRLARPSKIARPGFSSGFGTP